MQASQIPTKVSIVWASSAGSGFVRPIPNTSQIGVNDGYASWPTGFPPLCFVPLGSGGVPPFGQDMNGVLNQVSAWTRWQGGGGLAVYDAAYSTAVGGYPEGALISATTAGKLWLCLVDNNTSNPDAGGANWLPIPGKTQITGTLSVYVNPATGNDANDGMTALTAWRTLNHAYSWIQDNINAQGGEVVINCAFPTNPTNYDQFTATGPVDGVKSPGQLSILGDVAAKACTISGSFGGLSGSVFVNEGALLTIQGFSLANSGANGYDLTALQNSHVVYGSMAFGNATLSAVAANFGSIVAALPGSTNTFTGAGFQSLLIATLGGNISVGGSTMNTSATVSGSTVIASDLGIVSAVSTTFGGAGVTGSRFLCNMNGILDTQGAQTLVSTAYIPGSTDGSVAKGGQFQ